VDNLVAYLQDNISEELRSCVLSTKLHKQVIIYPSHVGILVLKAVRSVNITFHSGSVATDHTVGSFELF